MKNRDLEQRAIKLANFSIKIREEEGLSVNSAAKILGITHRKLCLLEKGSVGTGSRCPVDAAAGLVTQAEHPRVKEEARNAAILMVSRVLGGAERPACDFVDNVISGRVGYASAFMRLMVNLKKSKGSEEDPTIKAWIEVMRG